MSTLHLYFHPSDSKLTAIIDLPERPNFDDLKKDQIYKDYKFFTGFKDSDVYKQYEQAIASAIEKRKEIVNCEGIQETIIVNLVGGNIEKGKFYLWPGTFEFAYQKKVSKTWIDCFKSEYNGSEDFKKLVRLIAPSEQVKESAAPCEAVGEGKLKASDAGFKWFTCPTCDGSGSVPQDQPLPPVDQQQESQEELDENIDDVLLIAMLNKDAEAKKLIKKQFTITRKSVKT